MEKTKKPVALIVSLVLMTLIAVVGWSIAIYGMKEYNERTNAILELQIKNDDLQSELDTFSSVDDRYGNFITIDNWEVKFPYTDGVTAVKVVTGNKYDGSLYITSVTKDGKTYDVNSCGAENTGKFNDENPFYFAEVVRYGNLIEHDKDSKKPDEDGGDYSELSRTARYNYYINNTTNTGCEKDKGFQEGEEIARKILGSIQMKD